MSRPFSHYALMLSVAVAIASPGNAAAPPTAPSEPAGTAAVVNGETISMAELQAQAAQAAGSSVLPGMIDEVLVDQAAQTRHIVVTDADLKAKMAETQRSLGGQSLQDALQQHGMSLALFENNLRHQIELERLVAAPLNPARHMRHVWHITYATLYMDPKTGKLKTRTAQDALQRVQKLRDQLKAGAKFSDLARRYSEYAAEKQNGGDLSILCEGSSYYANLFPVAKALKKGEYTKQTVLSPAGYELLYVSSTAESHPPSEDAAYRQAAEDYRQQQLGDAASATLQALRSKARIAIYDQAATAAGAQTNAFAGQRAAAAHLVSAQAGPPGVAATVNGQAITTTEVEKRALVAAGPSVLQRLIDARLIDQAARAKHIVVTQTEIDDEDIVIMSRSGLPSTEAFLQKEQLTPDQFDSNTRNQIITERLADVPVKPATHMRHVYHIAIAAKDANPLSGSSIPALPGAPPLPTRAEALAKVQMIKDKLKAGAKFEDLATEYSSDIFSRRNGGDLGILHDGTSVNKDILKVALQTKKGEYSPIFKSFFGYDFVYVASTAEDHPAGEDEIYRIADNEYRDSQVNASASDVLQSLKQKAQIAIFFHP